MPLGWLCKKIKWCDVGETKNETERILFLICLCFFLFHNHNDDGITCTWDIKNVIFYLYKQESSFFIFFHFPFLSHRAHCHTLWNTPEWLDLLDGCKIESLLFIRKRNRKTKIMNRIASIRRDRREVTTMGCAKGRKYTFGIDLCFDKTTF